MSPPTERRFELRSPANARGIVVAPGFEMPCLIADQSGGGLRVRLDRAIAVSGALVVVDIAQGLAIEAEVAWSKGVEAGLKRRGQTSLRGLVPARLAPARAAWLRAGGR